MSKPSITTIIPGATFTTAAGLTIPPAVLTAAGLNMTTVTANDGARIVAAVLFALQTTLKDKYLETLWGVSCDGNFPSIGQKNDTNYYEVNSLTFSVFTPRTTSSIDPDNVI